MKLRKKLICKATKVYRLGDGSKFHKHGWRILGLFIEDSRRDWKDVRDNAREEIVMGGGY